MKYLSDIVDQYYSSCMVTYTIMYLAPWGYSYSVTYSVCSPCDINTTTIANSFKQQRFKRHYTIDSLSTI